MSTVPVAGKTRGQTVGRRMKVLIIDDDPDVRRIAHISLSQLGGMDVVEAGGSAEGVQQAAEEKPDVILLDIMMPRVDGVATIGSLRENPATANIPVIFLTARSADESDGLLRATGALGLLAKPFDPMTLASELRAILGR
jgi:CheY-like chemotaxis protein